MTPETYNFTGDGVTVLGLVGIISTGIILVLCFTRYFNSPPEEMTKTIKEFFTLDEWDLIHSLVANNSEFCEDDEHDPLETYTSIENKIYKLFENQ